MEFLRLNSRQFEIIIINDSSPDATGRVADDLARQYSEVYAVHHARNMGYTATLIDGYHRAKYEYVIYTDGDNQYDINDLEPHLNLLKSNDLIAGYAIQKAVSRGRLFQSWLHNYLIGVLFGVGFLDINCSMKVLHRSVLDEMDFKSSAQGAFIDAEIMLKATRNNKRIAQFPVVHYERKSGIASGSKPSLILYTIWDMVKLRLNLL